VPASSGSCEDGPPFVEIDLERPMASVRDAEGTTSGVLDLGGNEGEERMRDGLAPLGYPSELARFLNCPPPGARSAEGDEAGSKVMRGFAGGEEWLPDLFSSG
jgi:hypothetical protein